MGFDKIDFIEMEGICNDCGWGIDVQESSGTTYVDLAQCDVTEDFHIEVYCDNLGDLAGYLVEYSADFDPEEHAVLWAAAKYSLETPKNMRDSIPSLAILVDEAREIAESLEYLVIRLNRYLAEREVAK